MDTTNCDADPTNFSSSSRMVRVKAELCWKVECCAEPSLAVRYQILEAPVGFSSRAEPGILTHSPQPVSIHSIVDATRVRELPWFSQRSCPVRRNIFGLVDFLDRYPRVCCYWISQVFSPIFAMTPTSLDAAVSGSSSRLTTLPTSTSSSF